MKTWSKFTLASLFAVGMAATASADEITVYTALEEEEIAAYVEAAKKAMPETEINVLRLSTGKLGARLLAEAGNPQADVIWGWAVSAMMDPQILEMLEPYAAKGVDVLPASFRGEDGKWFAPIGYMGAFCVNTARLEEKGLPMPKSWKDLENPDFKGEILMPDPNSSGTGYLHVNAVLQTMGEEAGWAQLEAVDPNMAQYTSSGSKPCKSARVGEYTVGISLAFTAMQSIEEGYPLAMVFPEEGVSAVTEPVAILSTAQNPDAAKAFVDFLISEDGQKLAASQGYLPAHPGVPAPEGFPARDQIKLMKFDPAEALKRDQANKMKFSEIFGG